MAKATKATELEAAPYVEMLVKAGFSQSEAEKSIDTLIAKVNDTMKDEPLAKKKNTTLAKVREKIRASKLTKATALMLYVGEREDQNQIKRNVALALYRKDPEAALSQGMIKMIKGEPVAVDNRTTLDKAGKFENKMYGKEYPPDMKRQVVFVIDNKIMRGTIDANLDAGGVYNIYGKVSESNGAFYPSNVPAPSLVKKLNASEFFNEALEAMKVSDNAYDVYGATETDDKGVVLVKGYTQSTGLTSGGKGKIRLNDDSGAAITAFAQDMKLTEEIQRVLVNTEVIVVGRIKASNNPEFGPSIQVMGVISNPQTTDASDKLKDFNF